MGWGGVGYKEGGGSRKKRGEIGKIGKNLKKIVLKKKINNLKR